MSFVRSLALATAPGVYALESRAASYRSPPFPLPAFLGQIQTSEADSASRGALVRRRSACGPSHKALAPERVKVPSVAMSFPLQSFLLRTIHP